MKRLSLIAMVFALLITPLAAPAQTETTVDAPDWLVGKLTGEQKVTSRPTWAPAGLEVNTTSNVVEINLRVPGGSSQTIKGSVVTASKNTAVVKGKYLDGRNKGKEVTYSLRQQDGMIKGDVTAPWHNLQIEVTLQQTTPPNPRRSREVTAVSFSADRALHFACLAEAGIPDRDAGCSQTPQP